MSLLFDVPFMDLVAVPPPCPCTAARHSRYSRLPRPAVGFNDFPTGVQSGQYTRSVRLMDAATYTPAFLTAHGGSIDATRTFLLEGINKRQSYMNIQSSAFSRRRNPRLPGGCGRPRAGDIVLADARGRSGRDRLLRREKALGLSLGCGTVAASPRGNGCLPKCVQRSGVWHTQAKAGRCLQQHR